MPVLRKRAQLLDKATGLNGLYVHSSPPRVLQVSSAYIKQLIRTGDLDKLEQVVIDGQGKKLLGEYSADYKTRTYLKNVASLMSKISHLHDAVNSGKLHELQTLLEDEATDKRRRLVLCKDESGVGLLHKAVYYDLKPIYKYLIKEFPHMISMKDSEGRTAYHYTPMCSDSNTVQKLLTSAGADPNCLDSKQHSMKYYANHVQELELPNSQKSAQPSGKSSASHESLQFKKSNIRIWIHQRNLNNLQQVVWEGHGSKLLVEHSNNPKIKKFLEAVPHIMGLIRDVHTDAINGDLEGLKRHSSSPVPPVVLSGKDSNGLTALHKAAGLGKQDIVEFIVNEYPSCLNSKDDEGRTPLHYSVLLKDDGKMMNYLIENGADESALDNKQKTAAYYKTRTAEIDGKLLTVIPECPRSAKESFAANFDWPMLSAMAPINGIQKAIKKVEQVFGNNTESEIKDEKLQENGNNVESASEKAPKIEENGKAEEEVDAKIEPEENGNNGVEETANPTEETDVAPETNNEEANNNEPAEVEAQGSAKTRTNSTTSVRPSSPSSSKDNTDSLNSPRSKANSRPPSDMKSRPASDMKSRPSSDMKSRPASDMKSRPASLMKSRPASDMNEAGREGPVVEAEDVIEGVVNGENEVESMNNEGRGELVQEGNEDIAALVEAENMDQLAAMVLNGDGDKLVGQQCENSELQSFLDNVPVYMAKINRIHIAARDGSLRDLQAALDRRKFAVAKDKISPKSASPLHVAVIFGNTSIVRYLAGRFPETIQVTDEDNRTPLHYAATLADNGHYYNLLIHLGADTRSKDNMGRTPDYYRSNKEELNHRGLLQEFGVDDETVEELLNDKVPEDTFSARKDLDDDDMISVLERCYNVLHGRRNSLAISATSSITTVSSQISSSSLLSKHLKRYVFDTVKLRLTKLDHNLYDLIWPSVKKLPSDASFRLALESDFPAGIVAPDFYIYKVFRELIEPIVKEYNCIDLHNELGSHPESKFIVAKSEQENYNLDIDLDLDPACKWILSGTLDCTRNLAHFDLPKYLNIDQLEKIERIITTVLLSNDMAQVLYPNASEDELEEKGSGIYYTMNEVLEDPSEARVILASNGLLIPLWNIPESDRLHGKHWPYGRGVFVSNGNNLAVWVNVLDHIRIVTCTSQSKPGNVGQIYSRMCRIMTKLKEHMEFHFDDSLGYLSARPTALGNTLQFSLTLKFPHLIKEPDNLRHLCITRGLSYHKNNNATDVVRVGNQQSLNITELQLFEDFTTAVVNILQLEKDLAMHSSLHIAALFVNIFKKKRNSLTESNVILHGTSNGQVDMPFFATEEGRYLASSLGDPLIKGLTEVANKRPEDPIAYLATYLYNFANSRGNVRSRGKTQDNLQQVVAGSPQHLNDNKAMPATIDVVTLEPEENSVEEETSFSGISRDEHGQSMLHFASARAHGRNALFQLLVETEINVAYRDELYRTARDISIQANITENTEDIDRYVLHIATKGDTDKLVELLLDGYDHITDIVDQDDVAITEAVAKHNQPDTVSFLQSILTFEEKRERVHHAIRQASLTTVSELLADENETGSGKLLAIGKNSYGRCSLHIAVLCQQEEIVDYLASTFADTLKIGDNLERTALHYAMGVEKMETISRVLIKAGAKRIVKDLKGRQPTYYFLNKSEILRLQEEEETF